MDGGMNVAELVPEYYCGYMGRDRQPSVCKGIFTHLLAMVIAIGLCGSGYYYYEFVYNTSHSDSFAMKQPSVVIPKNEEKMKDTKHEPILKRPSHFNGYSQESPKHCKKELSYLKNEIAIIHVWKSAIDTMVSKMKWEQEKKIREAINNAQEAYEADVIGIMDYAAAYAGGTIVKISKDTQPHPTHRPISLFRIVSVHVYSSPEEILRHGVLPGSCFAFRGKQGAILVRLGKPIYVGGITLSHGSRLLLGMDGMNSAPKDFEAHGFTNDADNAGTFLGKFTYNWMGPQHQTFKIDENMSKNQIFELIELKILNNYGKEEFTCVYRFRVHRKDEDTSATKASQTSGPSTKTSKKCC